LFVVGKTQQFPYDEKLAIIVEANRRFGQQGIFPTITVRLHCTGSLALGGKACPLITNGSQIEFQTNCQLVNKT
jgi:hypothetical protein